VTHRSASPSPGIAAPTGEDRLAAAHTPEAVRRRLATGPAGSHLADLVYGAVDGIVTTFAVVAGVAGAGLAARIVLVLGVANLVADGFSMAVANYLGQRAEEQRRLRLRRQEELHVAAVPAGEREEVRQLLAGWRLDPPLLERVVDAVTSDRERWVELMMQLEHGVSTVPIRPLGAGLATFAAFLVSGSLPLLPFALDTVPGTTVPAPFLSSAVATLLAFVAVGAAKGLVVGRPWWRSAVETLVVGGAAASLAYAVGAVLGA
jgi:VIT1/CCC1 family predicted Fe2+/Mn2+ transporter